jgi:hypothetical protein
VGLKTRDLFLGIVIEHALSQTELSWTYKLKIIAAGYEPILAGNEPACTHRDLSDVESAQQQLGLVVIEVDLAIVERTEDPGLARVEVDGLDAV